MTQILVADVMPAQTPSASDAPGSDKDISNPSECRGVSSKITPAHRLATYGTLAPGKPNHHHLSHLPGRWIKGSVRGSLVHSGWGAELGFPALEIDPKGPVLHLDVFESVCLANEWNRLDEFEGEGYERVTIDVETAEGTVEAQIYAVARS